MLSGTCVQSAEVQRSYLHENAVINISESRDRHATLAFIITPDLIHHGFSKNSRTTEANFKEIFSSNES